MGKLPRLFRELSRRRVIRTVAAYVVVMWALSQGGADLFPVFGLPEWALRVFIITSVAGIPVVALLSWRFDLTAKGLVRDSLGSPGVLADEDLNVSNAREWADSRHDIAGAGLVTVIWTGPDGDAVRRQFFESFLIGREPSNEISLADPRVSRIHVVVYAEDRIWKVRDIDSSNGTYLDGKKISKADLPPSCQLSFPENGPMVELSIQAMDETALTTEAETKIGAD